MDPIHITGALGVATLLVLVLALWKIIALGKLVNQLAEKIPGTDMTAKELAGELGGSIDQAFSNYVPKPEQLASALKEAVETAGNAQRAEAEKLSKAIAESASALKEAVEAAGKTQRDEAEKLNQAFAESAAGVKDGLAAAGQSAAEPLQKANTALKEAAESVSGSIGAAAEKLQAVLGGHAQEVQNALQGVGGAWRDEISGALSEHAQKLSEANNQLAAQLEQIATLEKEIVKILHVQETVEGAMKEVAASEEFKATLEALRTHVQESDKLLREVAKPRTIRLVESDGEIAQT